MATANHPLSNYDPATVPDASGMRFVIVVSEWNGHITSKLRDGAYDTLLKHGAKAENVTVIHVPGSFELIFAAKHAATKLRPDAVIGLGCVIKGETPHFEYVCQGVTQGFAALNAEGDVPYIFGLLTDNNEQQSLDRAGGKLGNKGVEAAITAIKMAKINDA
ncbi:6,7-dimethyl-8-ribityllumazine synthase [Candidatus Symbiothrix dinenymphae]|uniref:6,7-dimethyl-8-ribityllumazine synthase n=1 Tax=Candidatus Symbiothrix dinenymphae TaxID=467085 RepID=UPI0006BEC5AC|nr:6,7-dimethyl-8-ribityllumazine synthase [Candidatus Symbiothrix dinenymphae]GAP73407.1 6,7-dimethyl-8-ribityllumazine synthase [Candidatus Symbiothrix dinenymphae]